MSYFSSAMAPKLVLPSTTYDIGLTRGARRLSSIETLEMLLGWDFATTAVGRFLTWSFFAQTVGQEFKSWLGY